MTMLTMDPRNEEIETFQSENKAEIFDEGGVKKITPLQLACKKGLLDIVKILLDFGEDVNETGTEENRPPVHLACYFGQYEILKRLFDKDNVTINTVNKNSLLHSVLQGLIGCKGSTDGHRNCFDYLLKEKLKDIPINHPDRYGHTALHYAAEFEDVHYTKALLQYGANKGLANEFGFSPLDYLSPQALKEILDDCVECKKIGDSEYNLTFNFSLMNPTESCGTAAQRRDAEAEGRPQVYLPEMSFLNFVSGSNKLGHLLKHPVLLVFLHLKWTRICMMFYINMIYYIIFVISLTVNILSENCSDGNYNGNWSAVWVILLVLWVILVVRELMQMCLLPNKWHYLCNLENILEIIIAFTIPFLFGYCYKILAAVTLLLAWMEVMLVLGSIYSLAVYKEMMKIVTLNYMKFLIWNLPLILAFSFSFYKLQHKENLSKGNGSTSYINNTSGNSCCQDDNVDFYSSLPLSLLKTVVMMIGEFDASSMSFDNGSYLVFLFFVFMLVIVMMNLLNGLAVSDTQAIRNDAELFVYRSRVTLVDRYESVVFGNWFINPYMSKLTCGLPSLLQGRLQKTLSLFPDSLQGQNKREQSVVLNKVPRFINLYIEGSDKGCRPFTFCKICKFRIGLDIDREVLIAAKNIADKRQNQSRHENSQIVNRIAKVEEDLQGFVDQLANLEELRKQ